MSPLLLVVGAWLGICFGLTALWCFTAYRYGYLPAKRQRERERRGVGA